MIPATGGGGGGQGSSSCSSAGQQSPQQLLVDTKASACRIRETYEKDFKHYPPGLRFQPSDHELIQHYLYNKVNGIKLPLNKILDIDIYQYNPSDLEKVYPIRGETEWYFFTPRKRKYANGSRPSRSADSGYWKATGTDKPIVYKNQVVGCKRGLVFYNGKAPKGDKTDWIMHEFTLKDQDEKSCHKEGDKKGMMLNSWVLCKIYNKGKSKNDNPVEAEPVINETDNAGAPDVSQENLHANQPQALTVINNQNTSNYKYTINGDVPVINEANNAEAPDVRHEQEHVRANQPQPLRVINNQNTTNYNNYSMGSMNTSSSSYAFHQPHQQSLPSSTYPSQNMAFPSFRHPQQSNHSFNSHPFGAHNTLSPCQAVENKDSVMESHSSVDRLVGSMNTRSSSYAFHQPHQQSLPSSTYPSQNMAFPSFRHPQQSNHSFNSHPPFGAHNTLSPCQAVENKGSVMESHSSVDRLVEEYMNNSFWEEGMGFDDQYDIDPHSFTDEYCYQTVSMPAEAQDGAPVSSEVKPTMAPPSQAQSVPPVSNASQPGEPISETVPIQQTQSVASTTSEIQTEAPTLKTQSIVEHYPSPTPTESPKCPFKEMEQEDRDFFSFPNGWQPRRPNSQWTDNASFFQE